MAQPLPFLISTDHNLLFAAATTLRSAHATLSGDFQLEPYVYVHEVPPAELERFSQFCEAELGVKPRLIADASFSVDQQHTMDALAGAFPRFPRPIWGRLFLPSLVTGSERAVYTDVDVAVIQDLSPLWSVPLNGHAVGAVRDPVAEPAAQFARICPRLQRYFNSGVMAIDLSAWERQRVSERCAEWILTTGRASHFPDQDALNAILMDEQGAPLWQQLDPIWNAISTRQEVDWTNEPPRPLRPDEIRLRHFAGSSKPWNTERLPLKSVFDEHLAAVPFPVPAHMRIRRRPSRARRLVRRARRWVRQWIPGI